MMNDRMQLIGLAALPRALERESWCREAAESRNVIAVPTSNASIVCAAVGLKANAEETRAIRLVLIFV